MKGLTIYQPWASLIAVGAKTYETRSWPTKYRGPVAIHAGKRKSPYEDYADHVFVDQTRAALDIVDFDDLPYGAIIAVADLVECWEILDDGTPKMKITKYIQRPHYSREYIQGNELLFGDYTPGRYAWEFANVKKLRQPIPWSGRQGLWTVPEDAEDMILRLAV
jgi:hypothetical protein